VVLKKKGRGKEHVLWVQNSIGMADLLVAWRGLRLALTGCGMTANSVI